MLTIRCRSPERQDTPSDVHAREPYPWRNDLKHQVVCQRALSSEVLSFVIQNLLGIMPTIYPHVKIVLICWHTAACYNASQLKCIALTTYVELGSNHVQLFFHPGDIGIRDI